MLGDLRGACLGCRDRERPQLRLAIERCRKGDVLVVVWIGWLARSLSHLLARASRGLGCKRPQPFRSRFGLDFEELTEVGIPNSRPSPLVCSCVSASGPARC